MITNTAFCVFIAFALPIASAMGGDEITIRPSIFVMAEPGEDTSDLANVIRAAVLSYRQTLNEGKNDTATIASASPTIPREIENIVVIYHKEEIDVGLYKRSGGYKPYGSPVEIAYTSFTFACSLSPGTLKPLLKDGQSRVKALVTSNFYDNLRELGITTDYHSSGHFMDPLNAANIK